MLFVVGLLLFCFLATVISHLCTLSLHDALPISFVSALGALGIEEKATRQALMRSSTEGLLKADRVGRRTDRKSTRLNSSHVAISYAVFCLKKKNIIKVIHRAHQEVTGQLWRYDM